MVSNNRNKTEVCNIEVKIVRSIKNCLKFYHIKIK
jgi:hypothetical protein